MGTPYSPQFAAHTAIRLGQNHSFAFFFQLSELFSLRKLETLDFVTYRIGLVVLTLELKTAHWPFSISRLGFEPETNNFLHSSIYGKSLGQDLLVSVDHGESIGWSFQLIGRF